MKKGMWDTIEIWQIALQVVVHNNLVWSFERVEDPFIVEVNTYVIFDFLQAPNRLNHTCSFDSQRSFIKTPPGRGPLILQVICHVRRKS
jgi:hypothetical protein